MGVSPSRGCLCLLAPGRARPDRGWERVFVTRGWENMCGKFLK